MSEINEDKLAKIYDNTPQPEKSKAKIGSPSTAVTKQPTSEAELANKFYGEKLSDPNDGMYGTQFKSDNERYQQKTLASDADVRALNQDATSFAADIGLSPQEANVVHKNLINNALKPPDEATLHKWEQETSVAMAQKYGPDRANQIIARAKSHLKNSPYLKRGKIGSPEALMIIFEKFQFLPLKGSNK